MGYSDNPTHRWEEIAASLSAYRDEQRKLWADVDDVTVTAYLCGTCTPEEKRTIEAAMSKNPAVKELVEGVQEVLQPAWVATGVATPVSAGGITAPVMALRTSLQVWLDRAGQLVSRGLELLMVEPESLPALGFAGIPMRKHEAMPLEGGQQPAAPEQKACCWRIPVGEAGYSLSVCATPAATEGRWNLAVEVASETAPQASEQARFSIARPDDIPVLETAVSRYAGRSIEIAGGIWKLTVTVGDDARVVPLELGHAVHDDP